MIKILIMEEVKKKFLKNLGRRIQAHRKNLKFSQEVFAEKIGRTPAYLSKIERGIKTPSLDLLLVIADQLQVPICDLLNITPPEKGPKQEIQDKMDSLLNIIDLKTSRLIMSVAQKIVEISRS